MVRGGGGGEAGGGVEGADDRRGRKSEGILFVVHVMNA